MRLKDLFKSYLDMNDSERTLFINELRIRRIPLSIIKKTKKQKVVLSEEEQALIDRILKGENVGKNSSI